MLLLLYLFALSNSIFAATGATQDIELHTLLDRIKVAHERSPHGIMDYTLTLEDDANLIVAESKGTMGGKSLNLVFKVEISDLQDNDDQSSIADHLLWIGDEINFFKQPEELSDDTKKAFAMLTFAYLALHLPESKLNMDYFSGGERVVRKPKPSNRYTKILQHINKQFMPFINDLEAQLLKAKQS